MPRWERHLTSPLDAPSRQEVARVIQAARGSAPVLERAGAVIEFRRAGKLLCGYLASTPSRHAYIVADVDGQQRRMRRDKVVDLSRDVVPTYPRDEGLRALRRIDERREEARRDVDLDTLWRVVLDAGDRAAAWSLQELLELQDPVAADATRRAGMLRALWHGDRFERDEHGWRPRSPEAVRQSDAAERLRVDEAMQVSELGAWLRRVADGGPSGPRPAGAARAVTLLEETAIGNGPAAEAARLMQAAHLHGAGAAFDALVRLGHWSAHENLELHRLRVPDSFGAKAVDAARRIDPSGAVAAGGVASLPCPAATGPTAPAAPCVGGGSWTSTSLCRPCSCPPEEPSTPRPPCAARW